MKITTIACGADLKPRAREGRADKTDHQMRLVVVRRGETDWPLVGRDTGSTDVGLTVDGRQQAAWWRLLFQRVPHGQRAVKVSSARQRAPETAAPALPARRMRVEPLVAQYDYGNDEGLTVEQIRHLAPGRDSWRDGCPDGESTAEVGCRADAFLNAYAEHGTQPVVVSATAAVSLIEDRHGQRCVGLWNADTALFADAADRAAHPGRPRPDPPVSAGELLP